ncbi:uncharacterized protein LOC114251201 [Bombyx mandarina]|uniref:Uncharacterized protein n=2 Tax=Bombyx TaxID=7090 RepID=A0A8R2AGW2_BOMMO|nr:uncharacterized protein LOC101736832 [Bombyx mori]XP_028041196.1 uncharacterized protein LOC114251201 [Bombyx mandarina]
MSLERRSFGSTDPQVTKRLFTIIVLLVGLLCIFGGYLLGRMARTEVKRANELLTHNLTAVADSLYKKAKRITPKVIHHNDPEKILAKLLDTFSCNDCGKINKYNLEEYVKNSINYQIGKLIKAVNNATVYLDSLS